MSMSILWVCLLLLFSGFGISSSNAAQCPIMPTQNRVAVVTMVAGVLGLTASLCVLLVIFGFKKDLHFPRERIIAGLAVANALYSVSSIIPLQMFHLQPLCTPLIPYEHLLYLRMSWFSWKFAILGYEIFIVTFSIYVLKMQTSVHKLSPKIEILAHSLCWLVAVAIMVVSCTRVSPLVDRLAANDTDIQDYDRYQEYVSQLTIVWLALFAVAIIMWLVMRFGILRRLRKEWASSYATNTAQWTEDYWDEGSKPLVETKKKLMVVQQQNFEEVAQPLERYVWVFLLFLPPSLVLATTYCDDNSSKTHVCESPAEMVLAFRSVATCAVYFSEKESRRQLRDWRTLFRKLRARIARCGLQCLLGDTADVARGSSVTWSRTLSTVRVVDRISYLAPDDEGVIDEQNNDVDVDVHVAAAVDVDGRPDYTHADDDDSGSQDGIPGRTQEYQLMRDDNDGEST
eukprot:m.60839 g.60839  ORF g.60839 m.60839 type:complete len:457 (-) comp22888_c0_seq1:200-1570(-)